MNRLHSLLAYRPGVVLWLAVSALLVTSCLVDTDHRCGTHQVQQGDLCACESGFGLVGNQCVACAEHEVGTLTGCECAAGFGRADSSSPCAPTAALGQPCASDADCSDVTFQYCRLEGDSGYCTHADCESSADCVNDYSCNAAADRSFCERPPTGFGQACATSADCANFEASYCESLSSKVCLKAACKADPSSCPGDWACCDIALLGNSLCLPQSELEAGACPAGGHLIPRSQ